MKITKNQLKRIIREEFTKLHESPQIRQAFRDAEPSPEEMKYKSQWHGDKDPKKAENDLEAAVFGVVGSLTDQGYDYREEIAPMILSMVEEILGL